MTGLKGMIEIVAWTLTHAINVGFCGGTAATVGELFSACGRACIAVGFPRLAEKTARPSVLRSFALVVHDVLASRMSYLFTPADRFDPGTRATQCCG